MIDINNDCKTCGGACCKYDWNIVFGEDENVPKRFSTTAHRMIGGTQRGERMMKKTTEGVCVCLKDGACIIYEKRPSCCRYFKLGGSSCKNLQSEKTK